MDKKLAKKNLKTALFTGAICLIIFGLTFVAAAIYNA
jgi:hypothetical protein